MLRSIVISLTVFLVAASAFAQGTSQNSNSSSTRTRTVEPKPTPTPAKSTAPASANQRPKSSQTNTAGGKTGTRSGTVSQAFTALLDGIRHSDVQAVTSAYEENPRLILFNYNGTVTRGWEQMKQNREASFPELKDVKLDVRDVRVTMLGPNAALVSCLWTQSQTFHGNPESASGRMTIVFKKVGKDWKAIHLHTSPDAPNPSRVMPSEQSPPMSKPTP